MSTQEDIAVTYDAPTEFYRLWLDTRMNYSCGLFEGTDSLEEAQVNKLRYMCSAARVAPGKRVLDIGCGWGAAMDYMANDLGIRDVHGITLSVSQYAEVARRRIPNATVECVSYRDYTPTAKFDAVVSIGMFEHVATHEETRTGANIDVYRDYFRRAWEWTTPGSWFSLQTVTFGRLPRQVGAVNDLLFLRSRIFPGAMMPKLESIFASVNPYWEVMEVRTRREHYGRTTAEWLRRLRANRDVVLERWGAARFDEYDRYLGACVEGFARGYHSLAQLSLRRIDQRKTSRRNGDAPDVQSAP